MTSPIRKPSSVLEALARLVTIVFIAGAAGRLFWELVRMGWHLLGLMP